MRLALITEIISHYRLPVFNDLAARLDAFLCLYLRETSAGRQWRVYREDIKHEFRVLRGMNIALGPSRQVYANFGLPAALGDFEPDLVVSGGYNHTAALQALLWSRRRGKTFILWSESTLRDQRPKRKAYEAYKRWFVGRCDRFLASGSAARAYLQHLGAAPERIWIAPDAACNDWFGPGPEERRPHEELTRFIFSGRLIPGKGIDSLLEAYRLASARAGMGLTIVGDGPERARLEDYCRRHRLREVTFAGFVQPKEMAGYYRMADALVFPSLSDVWGLVINEAMASGLPVITSTAPGAVDDLLIEGRTGFSFRPGDVQGMARALEDFARLGREARRRMSDLALAVIAHFTPQRCARGFLEAAAGTANATWDEFVSYRRLLETGA